MSRRNWAVRNWSTLGLVLASLVLSACGGSGHGFSVSANPIHITSNTLPQTLSGEPVNFCIPFTGGSGGPYILDVIDGAMPLGVTTDDQTVCLVGRALEDGTFDFTLKLTDTGSRPFTFSTMTYHWVVPIGSLVFGTDTVLPPWVYNRFDSVNLIVAGGVPPYSCEVVIEDPMIDELLPTGLSIPADSCSIVGAPTAIKSVAPFTYNVSVRARDHANDPGFPTPSTVTKRFVVTVLVPPIVIVTTSVPNGKCGTNYVAQIDIVDGIPPFTHALSVAAGSSTLLKGDLQSVGGVAKGTADSAYATDTTVGPYSGKFPEGLYMRETTGQIFGTPRRMGAFNAWIYYVHSNTLPTVSSQNAWKAYNFAMADGVPPNVALNPAFLVPGAAFGPVAPNNIPDGEVSKTYNLQFLATNGVPADGFSDAPTETKRQVNGEVAGTYDWSLTTWPLQTGGVPPPGLTFTVGGRLSGSPTIKQGARNFNATARDFQLPLPVGAGHIATGIASISVGPDAVVITESGVANDNNQYNSHSAQTTNNVSFEYQGNQTVEILEPFSAAATVRPLDNAKDLIPAHTSPLAPRTLAQTLSNIDLMAVTVNPTWWAYDAYNYNPQGARSMQHGDTERAIGMNGYNEDLGWGLPVNSQYYQLGYSSTEPTFEHASSTAVLLPNAPSVAVDIVNGVYNDGAQLYGFENSTEFGVFIIHTDGKIDIPVAFNKVSAGFEGFGDAVLTSNITKVGAFRRPQMTVSPDGRFGAMKVKVDVDNFAETSAAERIVIFSLTGEKPFAGASSRILTTGGAGNTTDGQYLYGDSLTLTNTQLYFVKGNNVATLGSPDVIYKDHWLYRVAILSGTPTLVPAPSVASTTWPSTANTVGNPLAMAFHRWGSPGASSVGMVLSGGNVTSFGGTSTNFGPTGFSPGSDPVPRSSFTNTSPTFAGPDFYVYQWANFAENSSAPHPMRVSKDGKACAILASDATGGAINTTNFQNYGIFVDYEGVASIREAATRRRFRAPTRLAGCRAGDRATQLYGWYDGPATQLEISDDGKTIAAVYNASTASWSNSGASNASSSGSREELIVSVSGGAASDPWSSKTETNVTSTIFLGSHDWRFGALAFTRDAKAVVFWGGCSLSNPQGFNPTDVLASQLSGSMYVYYIQAIGSIAAGTRQGILPQAQGGSTSQGGNATITYTASSTYAPSITIWAGTQGAIQPIGSFYSNDGNFYYCETRGAINASDPTARRIIGVNVKDGTTALGGRAPLQAFAPGWFANRGFGTVSYYDYPNQSFYYGKGAANHRIGDHATSNLTTNGTMYFAMYNQPSNWKNNTTAITGGGPAYNSGFYDYSAYGGDIFAMDTNVGSNAVQLTSLGSTTLRQINYIQPSRTGKSVAFQSSGGGQFGDHYANQENIRMVTNVAFTSGGALSGTPSLINVETANGRAGPSMTFDASDARFYYAWKTGATNENQMELVEVVLNASGTALDASKTRRINGVGGTPARFTVLSSGR